VLKWEIDVLGSKMVKWESRETCMQNVEEGDLRNWEA
jgi:hypothetical protein